MRVTDPKDRLANHKKTADADDGRRRREDTRISLRKQKQGERLAKRRTATIATAEVPAPPTEAPSATSGRPTVSVDQLPTIVPKLSNATLSEEEVTDAVRAIRRMLSVEQNPPVDAVIDAQALPPLVKLLACTSTVTQFEAAWALTNIASTNRTRAVVDAYAVPNLVSMLLSQSAEVREQAAWCLGNIAGEGPDLRDLVLNTGAMSSLILNIQNPANESLLQNTVWTVSNLCRGKPQPPLALVGSVISPLCYVVLHSEHEETVVDALWALSYLSDGEDDRIEAVLQCGITRKLVELVAKGNSKFVAPALRTLGNFVTGNEHQTQAVIDANILDVVGELLQRGRRNVRKEVCWLLSNIAAGTTAQIETLFKQPNLLREVSRMAIEAEWDVRKEAIWTVSNVCTGGSDGQVQTFVQKNAIEAMCAVLSIPSETRMLFVAFDALEKILTVGERNNRDYVVIVDECNGIDALESLQEHDDHAVYERVVSLIDRFFGEAEEDENLVPASTGNTFDFGMAVSPKATHFDVHISHEASPMAASSFNNTLEFH